MIAPPRNQDLLNIVIKCPELVHLAPKLIETYERMNQLIRFQLGITSTSSHNDRFTLRDLLKFCKELQVRNSALERRVPPLMHATTFVKRQKMFLHPSLLQLEIVWPS